MMGNRWALLLLLVSVATSLQAANKNPSTQKAVQNSSSMPQITTHRYRPATQQQGVQLFTRESKSSDTITSQRPPLILRQTQSLPNCLTKPPFTIRNTNTQPVASTGIAMHENVRPDALTQAANSNDHMTEAITEYIESSNIAALTRYDDLVKTIPGTIRDRFSRHKHIGSITINHIPYYGAIIIAIQKHAVEALRYLVTKTPTTLSTPLGDNFNGKTLGHYAIHIMAYDSFLSEKTAHEMMTILHQEGGCELEFLSDNAGRSMLQIAAASPYSETVMGYFLEHVQDYKTLQRAFNIALQVSSSDTIIERMMKHEACVREAIKHIIEQRTHNQHIGTIIRRNPGIILELEAISKTTILNTFSLTRCAAIAGDWPIIQYLLSSGVLTKDDLLTRDDKNNIFKVAYDYYDACTNPNETYAQEKRAAFMQKCLELFPLEVWMPLPEHRLAQIRESLKFINQTSTERSAWAEHARRFIDKEYPPKDS